ncbi:MAG: M1 family peptidase, partial [Bacteroidota bacterium]
MNRLFLTLLLLFPFTSGLLAQNSPSTEPAWKDQFRQLYEVLPTPNAYRNGAGMPGHAYWQNRADYDMDIRLDDEKQQIYGTETITYHNQSPDQLYYLWLQLDQNMRAKDSDTYKVRTGTVLDEEDGMSFKDLSGLHNDFDGGFKIEWVQDPDGKPMPYTINRTMMRVDLAEPLTPGASVSFRVKWWYNINERAKIGGRSGFEYFPEDDNYLYTIAQFFPRMCQYNDIDGWQNKQFLGRGEFTLPFGDYAVRLTVPGDHVVAATGELQNSRQLLTAAQRRRLEKARTANEPVIIITEDEARAAEGKRATDEKTWTFEAENVRDFAFASSRKFMWDAQGVPMGDRTVLAMSYYPKEGNPLWERYSTRSVVHTLKVYSRHTFDYPYPVAI